MFPRRRIPGCGVYLRTDFWARIESGGSYGHTCYVAKELAAVTESFVCFMANPFKLLDEYGLKQIVMPRPGETNNEDDIAAATPHYVALLRPWFETLRPTFIYERLALGNREIDCLRHDHRTETLRDLVEGEDGGHGPFNHAMTRRQA